MGGIIQVSSAGKARDFSLRQNAKIGSGSQGVLVFFGPDVKWPSWDGDHSPLLNAEVANEWNYTAPLHIFMT